MQNSHDGGADHTDSAEGAPIATRWVELGVALALFLAASQTQGSTGQCKVWARCSQIVIV